MNSLHIKAITYLIFTFLIKSGMQKHDSSEDVPSWNPSQTRILWVLCRLGIRDTPADLFLNQSWPKQKGEEVGGRRPVLSFQHGQFVHPSGFRTTNKRKKKQPYRSYRLITWARCYIYFLKFRSSFEKYYVLIISVAWMCRLARLFLNQDTAFFFLVSRSLMTWTEMVSALRGCRLVLFR